MAIIQLTLPLPPESAALYQRTKRGRLRGRSEENRAYQAQVAQILGRHRACWTPELLRSLSTQLHSVSVAMAYPRLGRRPDSGLKALLDAIYRFFASVGLYAQTRTTSLDDALIAHLRVSTHLLPDPALGHLSGEARAKLAALAAAASDGAAMQPFCVVRITPLTPARAREVAALPAGVALQEGTFPLPPSLNRTLHGHGKASQTKLATQLGSLVEQAGRAYLKLRLVVPLEPRADLDNRLAPVLAALHQASPKLGHQIVRLDTLKVSSAFADQVSYRVDKLGTRPARGHVAALYVPEDWIGWDRQHGVALFEA